MEGDNKKGLSSIIATLLIILLVFVVIIILWIVLKAVIKSNTEQISLGKFTVNLEITSAKIINGTNVNIHVKRNLGDGEVYGVFFIFYDNDNSESKKYLMSLSELQEMSFEVFLSELITTNLEKVAVAPVFKLESGKEIVGDITDEWIFNSAVYPPVTPPSSLDIPDTWTGNLVTDGGFESGTLNSWQSTANFYVTTSHFQSGIYSAYNQVSTTSDYIRQDVDLSSWSSYISSGDARINASAYVTSFDANDRTRIQFIFLDSGGSQIGSPALDTGYNYYSVWDLESISNIEVPSNAVTLRVLGNTYDSTANIDSGGLDSFSVYLGYFD